ncbi:hypothetical protein L2E82_27978 [Cichorium intybus]|uniref:Uncharacterized protein n=1 Tax=Cichorium intybus TaxID=13427 RepID=A0ACB9CUS3_CICIN|nr:hypothetical protein L2E82_27978 [Cichorium intybus]
MRTRAPLLLSSPLHHRLSYLLFSSSRRQAALQKELGLPIRDDIPLIGFIGRLDAQKGVDLIAECVPSEQRKPTLPTAVAGGGGGGDFCRPTESDYEGDAEVAIVTTSPVLELLATFCDNILKKCGTEKLSDEAIEDTLEKLQVVKLLAYISDKYLFAEFYRKKLARRLLFDKSANDEHERSILTKLKQQCGGNNTNANPGIDFIVTVLTIGFSPSYKSFDLNLPIEMVKCVEIPLPLMDEKKKPDVKAIKKRIEDLITRDYLEREIKTTQICSGVGCMVAAVCGATQKEPTVVGKPSTFLMDFLQKKVLREVKEWRRKSAEKLTPRRTSSSDTISRHDLLFMLSCKIVFGVTEAKGKDVKHLEIPLTDIKTATKNFSKAYLIGSGTYGDVYKAEIDHFDSKNFLPSGQKIDNGERPKKRSTAAIKLIKIRQDQQGEEGFYAEIEMLTSFTDFYLDPEYDKTGKLNNKTDIYSFGVVLFEMLSGRLANDPIYINENENGIAHVARRRFNDKTIKDMVDPRLWNETHGKSFTLTKGPNQYALHAYLKIAYQCVAETQAQRPTAEVIIKKLEKASSFQEGDLEHLEIPLSDILSATENFAKTYLIGSGIHGEMYKAEVDHFDGESFLSFEKKNQVCFDSEHDDTGELKYDTDIYSFGVVLFEIMSGRFAHDPIYTKENSKGIVPIACRRFNEGTIREMVDHVLMEETHVNTLYKGPGEDSLEAFSKIAYQCVTEHPVVEVILKKLEEALYFQENIKDHLKYPLEYILLATQNFSHNNLIGEGGFGSVYLGKVTSTHGDEYNTNTVAVKRLDRRYYEGDDGFLEELQTLFEYKHENIIGIVGYCVEKGENIIVYEYAPRGRLNTYLKDSGLKWMRRLQICIDIATGLDFLHGVLNKETDSSYGSLVTGTVGYVDPLYKTTGIFTKESDIYSFGVVLFEILSRRFVIEQQDLTHFFKCHYEEDNVDEIVFEGIKEQIAPKSLTTFVTIAYQCLHHAREDRPTTSEVLLRLKEALEYQVQQLLMKSDLNMGHAQQFSTNLENYDEGKKLLLLNGVNKKKHYMLPAEEALYKSSDVKLFNLIPSTQSRLSPNTEYACYLVFKLSEKCRGLYCPVIVRDLLKRKNKEKRIIYFRSPSPCNVSDTDRVPEEREDGWMEVNVWQFNSSNKLRDNCVSINLKLISYEGTMYGLIVNGIEFRPI